MLDITKLSLVSGDNYNATVALHPLQPGRGHTLGNSLRRALLNDLPGAAVTSVRIKGAPHQYMSIHGMKEDVVEFLLNVKQLRFINHSKEPVTLKLSVKGPKEVTAADISENAEVEVVNKNLVLGHLADEKSSLQADLVVSPGIGYETVEDRNALDPNAKADLGEIQLDALYSPVVRVNYRVENSRVGRITNYDKLVLDIVTDGTITVLDAIKRSAKILADNFAALSELNYEDEAVVDTTVSAEQSVGTEVISLEELDLPPKIVNRLKEHGFSNVQEVVGAGKEELLKIPNFGEKSFKELEEKIVSKGYEF